MDKESPQDCAQGTRFKTAGLRDAPDGHACSLNLDRAFTHECNTEASRGRLEVEAGASAGGLLPRGDSRRRGDSRSSLSPNFCLAHCACVEKDAKEPAVRSSGGDTWRPAAGAACSSSVSHLPHYTSASPLTSLCKLTKVDLRCARRRLVARLLWLQRQRERRNGRPLPDIVLHGS